MKNKLRFLIVTVVCLLCLSQLHSAPLSELHDSYVKAIKGNSDRLDIVFDFASKAIDSSDYEAIEKIASDLLEMASKPRHQWLTSDGEIDSLSAMEKCDGAIYLCIMNLFDYDDAIFDRLSQQYLETLPNSAMAHVARSYHFRRTNNFKESKECLIRADRLLPDYPGIVLELARMQAVTGDYEQAKFNCDRIMSNPGIDDSIRESTEQLMKILDENCSMMSPYYFANQFLSSVSAEISAETAELYFGSPSIFNNALPRSQGLQSPFKDSDIEITRVDTDGQSVYVWRFPEPDDIRVPLFMAFIPVGDSILPVAISRGQMVDWEISVSDEKSRSTYGRVKRPESAEECVSLLKERGAFTGHISPGEFFQKDYTAP